MTCACALLFRNHVCGRGAAAGLPSFARLEVIDPHALYPEGPLWWHGKLYYVEYAGNGIKVWNGKTLSYFWKKMHCGPNGLVTFGHDDILVVCYDGNYLVELDRNGKEVRTISQDDHGASFIGPNDLTSDGRGGVYFSALGVYDVKAPIEGKVLHVSSDGNRVSVVADTIDYSNGLTLSKDGHNLLVAEMLADRICHSRWHRTARLARGECGRACRIWRHPRLMRMLITARTA